MRSSTRVRLVPSTGLAARAPSSPPLSHCSTTSLSLLANLLLASSTRGCTPPLPLLSPTLPPVRSSCCFFARIGIDVVCVGSNPGCGTDGFPATSGWDVSIIVTIDIWTILTAFPARHRPWYSQLRCSPHSGRSVEAWVMNSDWTVCSTCCHCTCGTVLCFGCNLICDMRG